MTEAIVKSNAERDLRGTAYGKKPGQSDEILVGVKAGTPAGEWLRRYWHPIALSAEVTSRPRTVMLLGEEHIIFRDGKGAVGLLYPRCVHRGTSLYYGRVEEAGIRCCYHGWLFDVEGNCLEQPCEPEGGLRRDAARQPWYPVEERYGFVFAYMGPPDRMPVLPRYDILENLEEGEFIQAWGGTAAMACVDFAVEDEAAPFHWTHVYENVLDPFHSWVLHGTHAEAQAAEYHLIKPVVKFEREELGAVYHAYRDLDDGRRMKRTSYALLPNVGAVPPVDVRGAEAITEGPANHITWYVPTDDEAWVGFAAFRTRKEIKDFYHPMTPDGRRWSQMTEEEHRDYPGDYEAQSGQGTTTLHSEEHLAQSDMGVVMLRRMMKEQIKAVQNGENPLGVEFDESKALVKIVSGNYFESVS